MTLTTIKDQAKTVRQRERENESEKKEEICEDDAQKNKREKTRMQNIGAMLREKKSIR